MYFYILNTREYTMYKNSNGFYEYFFIYYYVVRVVVINPIIYLGISVFVHYLLGLLLYIVPPS